MTTQAVEQAIQLGMTHLPNLFIVDSHLPKNGDGTKAIRQLSTTFHGVPIIATSTDARRRLAMLAAGARQFVPKPLDMPQLCSTMKTVLSETSREEPAFDPQVHST